MTFIHNLHGNCIYLYCVHEIMDLHFMKLWLQRFIHLTMYSLGTTCLYSQFTVVGERSGVGMSSENKLQFNSSGVAPVEGRGCC